MLVLTRKVGESITIGDDIRIYIQEVRGNQVKVGISAPPDVAVHREEIYRRIQQENQRAAQTDPAALADAHALYRKASHVKR